MWPIKSTGDGGKLYFSPYVKKTSEGDDKRFHAPWTKFEGSYYWPRALLRELEEARQELKDDKTLHHVSLTPYGLVSFVDELVYHATPFSKSRTEEDLTKLFRDVTFSGNAYKILPPKLERTVSKQLAKGDVPLPTLTGGAKTRCFLRLWISVARKCWYDEYSTFNCAMA